MLVRWNPTDDLSAMENMMRGFFGAPREGSSERSRLNKPAWVPPVDAWETENDFHLVFDVPGVKKEDIEIEVEGDQLTIKGSRKLEDSVEYIRRERVFGDFYRAFTLESPIERDKIKAIFKMGVLEVVLPKKEEIKPKQIQIQIEEE